jgi:hypothetical protein
VFRDCLVSAVTLLVTRLSVNYTQMVSEKAKVMFKHISFTEHAGLSKVGLYETSEEVIRCLFFLTCIAHSMHTCSFLPAYVCGIHEVDRLKCLVPNYAGAHPEISVDALHQLNYWCVTVPIQYAALQLPI